MQLKGRNIVITGSAGGLGLTVLETLMRSGAFCSLPVLNEKEADQIRSYAKSEGFNQDQLFIRPGFDLTDADATEAFYSEAEDYNPVWASVNLAGGFAMGNIEKTRASELDKMMQINAYTCFNSCKSSVRVMRKRRKGGRIVNVASRPGEHPRQGAGLIAYAMSKSAVIALTQSLAEETYKEDILVNAVSPSIIDTQANRQAMPKANHDNWPKPEDIATAIGFLLSPDNVLTHGAVLPVYGKE